MSPQAGPCNMDRGQGAVTMGSGLSRIVFLTALLCTLNGGLTAAMAGTCPGNPNALGTSRTIVVDPREHLRIGTMDYAETLPLVDREVVLTFDDGPLPPFTTKILNILAAECVHATYFMVGTMAREFPALARSVYEAGHTIGTHSMNHPFRFRALSVDRGNAEIDDGIAAVGAALGDPDKVAPFFRFPGFGHTAAAQDHAASRGLMVWGADVPADDWRKLGPHEVARRAVQRLEHKGKGILLLHDIHQRTVDALPFIFEELKARGFRIVHIVPASPQRTPTVTAAADWLPGSRPNPAAPEVPVILLADVLEPEADLPRKSAEALCSLTPPREKAVGRMAGHRHPRRAAMRMARYGHAKARPGEFPQFNATAERRDIHATVQ
jgi:peptidoglycan/xylan/chitin deacetylase (PgdA/CDA1 family)